MATTEQKDLKKLMTRRSALVDGLLSVLERKVDEGEKHLLKTVIDKFVDKLELTPDDRVKNTLYNKRLLASVDNVFNDYGKTMGVEIAKTIAQGVQSVVNFGGEYYRMFTTKAKLLTIQPKIQETMGLWLGLSDRGKVEPNGYLDKLIKDTTVRNDVKNLSVRAVIGQQGWQETKKQLSEFIVGNQEKTGALQKYHRNFVYDMYSQVDRATAELYANNLGFEFAIYEGGIIKTTRPFCRERNGKVFHKSEIALFDPEKAKQPGYNPFTDLGGYACRHHLNWIPNSLAFMLRPDARDLIKGGSSAPVPAAKPVKAPAPKKVDAPAPAKVEPKPAAPQKVSNIDSLKSKNDIKKAILESTGGLRSRAGGETKVAISADLDLATAKVYAKQLTGLFGEYSTQARYIDQISFKSSRGKYGSVLSMSDNGIRNANFGDRFDASRSVPLAGANKITLQRKSRVDEGNLRVSTLTHEFAHTIAINTYTSQTGKDFFRDLKVLKADYHLEVNRAINVGDIDGAAKIYLGKYASTNLDEFWAEAFTEYKLSSTPSKYAKLVGKLGDKYFKK